MSKILLGFLDPDHSGRYSDRSVAADDVFLRHEPDEEEEDDEDDGKNDDDDNNDDDGDGDDGYSE